MQFRMWLEEILSRDVVKKIVLDAVGGGNLNQDGQGDVLGSHIEEQPKLLHNLEGYSEMKPYMDEIRSFVASHQQGTLLDLINFISGLDHSDSNMEMP